MNAICSTSKLCGRITDLRTFFMRPSREYKSSWFSDVSYWLLQGGASHLLGFNVAERPGRANFSPTIAQAIPYY
jgi:hypothetical protein